MLQRAKPFALHRTPVTVSKPRTHNDNGFLVSFAMHNTWRAATSSAEAAIDASAALTAAACRRWDKDAKGSWAWVAAGVAVGLVSGDGGGERWSSGC